jgi:hypothetical protein
MARKELPLHLPESVLYVSHRLVPADGILTTRDIVENGTIYDQTAILNPTDYSLNKTAYAEFGQPWQSGSQVIYYLGLSMSIGATLVHIALWHGGEIWTSFRDTWQRKPIDDPHYHKMLKYPEVPMWWYGGITAAAFVCAMVTAYTEHSQLPWYALIIGLVFAFLWLPFYGAMNAITG